MIIGGGVSDIESHPIGRHGHWDKHGRWREDVMKMFALSPGDLMNDSVGGVTMDHFRQAEEHYRMSIGSH